VLSEDIETPRNQVFRSGYSATIVTGTSRSRRRLKERYASFSILDLAPITLGSNAAQAFRNSLDLAQHAERWGYHRYWLAEHHNMPAVASAGNVCGHRTCRCRHVDDPGGRRRHHAAQSLAAVIAEQFGTLESLFPKRSISDWTARRGAIRSRRWPSGAASAPTPFRRMFRSSSRLFREPAPANASGPYRRRPARAHLDSRAPACSARRLAAELGLPFAFASHFAPAQDDVGDRDLSHAFPADVDPERRLERSHLMLGLNIVAADTDDEARRLFTSHSRSSWRCGAARSGRCRRPSMPTSSTHR
jgi:alkanesulfonate monooxygenase SsuD/methylene tetrahydromethanopterin reductase-like flavin-dependent oxidoreductase (luciferase family)